MPTPKRYPIQTNDHRIMHDVFNTLLLPLVFSPYSHKTQEVPRTTARLLFHWSLCLEQSPVLCSTCSHFACLPLTAQDSSFSCLSLLTFATRECNVNESSSVCVCVCVCVCIYIYIYRWMEGRGCQLQTGVYINILCVLNIICFCVFIKHMGLHGT